MSNVALQRVISVLNTHNSIFKQKNFINVVKAAIAGGCECLIKLILQKGFDKNAALDIAINTGNERIITLLIDGGAEADEGLYFAIKANKISVITLLLGRGANINTRRRQGNTPLHVAIIQKSDVDVVAFLIEHKSNCNIQNEKNKTPLDLVQNLLRGKIGPTMKEKLQRIEDILKRYTISEGMFECLTGLPDGLSGYIYQIKLLTLYAVINTKLAISQNYQYELGSEVKDVLPFDDIFLRKMHDGRTNCHFVQVKQTKKPESEAHKLVHSTFFTILKSGLNMRDYIKGNDTIVKMFISVNEITNTHLANGASGEFIYCTNTTFLDSPCSYFVSVNTENDDLLCGIGRQKWKIPDWRYIHIEIKFVLLNLIQGSRYFKIMEEELKNSVNLQIETLNNFNIDSENKGEKTLWSVLTISKEALSAIDKYLNYLGDLQNTIKNAKDVEQAMNSLPDECEVPYNTDDLLVYVSSAIVKIHELGNAIKNDKHLFLHFSKWDDIAIQHKIEHFAEHFTLYTSCPNSDELDELIRKEIREQFKFQNSKFFSDYCVQYFGKWVSDFKNGRGILFTDIDGKQLFHKLRGQIFRDFSKSYIEEVQTHDIFFKNESKQIFEFLNNNNNVLHVITEHTRLHAMRILQNLKTFESKHFDYPDSVLFTSSELVFKSDETVNNFLSAFASNVINDFLVIEFSDNSKEYKRLHEVFIELKQIITNDPAKKIIIIAKSDNIMVAELKETFKEYDSCLEPVEFKDLKEESQEIIVNTTVNFQNNPNSNSTDVKLKDFLTVYPAYEMIDEQILSMIITKKESIKVGNIEAFHSAEYNREYYIPRRVYHQLIDSSVISNSENNLMFVTGTSKDQIISKFHGRPDLIHLWEENKMYDVGIIVMPISSSNDHTNQEIFTAISNKCDKNVYWLEFQDELIFWKGIKYRDSDDLDLKACNKKIQEKYSFPPHSIDEKIIILANHPGEGKSIMLTDLAHAMKETFPDLWIIRVDLKKHIGNIISNSLNLINFTDEDTLAAVEMITCMVVQGDPTNYSTKLERKLLEATLNGHGKIKVALLFDGFDEICPDYKDKTCILLKALKRSNVKQIWVTTRVHMKRYLEEQLQIPAYILAPLTQKQQVQFLNRFWKYHLRNYNDSEEVIITEENIQESIIRNLKTCYDNYCKHTGTTNGFESLINIINEKTKSNLKVLRGAIDDILDLSTCAEILLNEWMQSICDDDEFSKIPLHLKMLAENIFKSKWQISNLKHVGIFEIYKRFIEGKIEIYQAKRTTIQSGNAPDEDLTEIATVIIRKMHRELAVKTLCKHSRFLPDLDICNEYKDTYEKLTKIGLVKSYGNRVEFVHRSYAEYFLSEYISIHFENFNVQDELLEKILIYQDYNLIRTFLDVYLSQNKPKYCSPKVLRDLIKKQNERGQSVLHLTCLDENHNISAFILNNLQRQKNASHIIIECANEKPNTLHIETWKDNKDVYNLIMDTVKECPDILNDMTIQKDNKGQIALNSSLWVDNREAHDIIIKNATEHHNVLRELIIKCDKNNQTALHLAAYNNKTEVCDLIMNVVTSKDLKNITTKCDKNGETALHIAASCDKREICKKILESVKVYPVLFKELIMMSGKEGKTALHAAAMNDKIEICDLILRAANEHADILRDLIMMCDKEGRTALHTAVLRDKIQLFTLILRTAKEHPNILGDLVMKSDEEGLTALHITALYNKKDLCGMILGTVKEQPDVFKNLILKSDIEGRSILSITAFNDTKQVCELIFEYVKDRPDVLHELIMMCDNEGNTALDIAANRISSVVGKVIVENVKDDNSLQELLKKFDREGRRIRDQIVNVFKEEPIKEVLHKGEREVRRAAKRLAKNFKRGF